MSILPRRHSRRFRTNGNLNSDAVGRFAPASPSAEHLEQRQVLSASSALTAQTITVSATIEDSSSAYIRIEEVRQVQGEIHVLSRLYQTPYSGDAWLNFGIRSYASQGIYHVMDSVTINAPNLPIRYFQVGGTVPSGGEVTKVESMSSFHRQLNGRSSELLFGRVDAALSQWRDTIEARIIERADELYGDSYGKASPGYWHHWWNVRPMPGAEFQLFATANDTATVRVSTLTTNVQVAGVDEADLYETDGEYLYTISRKEVVVVRAATAESEAKVVSRLQLEDTPLAMFLQGNRLTVISNRDTYTPYGSSVWGGRYQRYETQTVVSVVDVSDQTAPSLVQETIVDGTYQSARAIGDQVYLVITDRSAPFVPGLSVIWDSSSLSHATEATLTTAQVDGLIQRSNARNQTREEYLQSLAALVHGDQYSNGWTPQSAWRRPSEGETGLQSLGWLDNTIGEADEVPLDGASSISVLQFDAQESNPGPVSNVSISQRGYGSLSVYASRNAMYLATTESTSTTDPVSGETLWNSGTRIHKIGLTDGGLVAEGDGLIEGVVLNQFSMDEHDGFLRVFTSDAFWNIEGDNQLHILEDTGDVLSVVGSVAGIAPTERIYSARFDGDRGWLVTFRQTDPVFSFDLSDPRNPRITGELHIPGFSDYMQLIDENHLLTIGRNATDAGWVQELQLSLFDISDMSQPVLLHRHSIDIGAYSTASRDHLAFNYMPAAGMLAIPIGYWGDQRIHLFHVSSETGFQAAGIVGGPQTNPGVIPWWSQTDSFLRSVQIDDLLYAISQNSIHVVGLADPETLIQQLDLRDEEAGFSRMAELPEQSQSRVSNGVRVRTRKPSRSNPLDVQLHFDAAAAGISLENVANFEFRIRKQDGTVLLTLESRTSDLSLTAEQQRLLGSGTYTVEVRTMSSKLRNAAYGAWSQPQTVSLGAESPELLSGDALTMSSRRLEWSRVPDRLVSASGRSAVVNEVSGYELVVQEAKSRRRVFMDRDLKSPLADLELGPGHYVAWIRAKYQTGGTGTWTAKQSFRILGERIELNELPSTASTSPMIRWQPAAGAQNYTLEVTNSDGTQVIYTADSLTSASHQVRNRLAPGEYSVRIRGNLSSGVETEWSLSRPLIVAGRPEVTIAGSGYSWNQTPGALSEVWINVAGTSERVYHSSKVEGGLVSNMVRELGLRADRVYDIWVRNLLPDGSKTAWSAKATINPALAEKVTIRSMDSLAADDVLTVSWLSASGVKTYEIYVSKDGQFLFRQDGIRGNHFTLPGVVSAGTYQIWVRGEGALGMKTTWGNRLDLTVTRTPVLSMSGTGVLSWPARNQATGVELWIDEVDAAGRQLKSKLVHVTNLTATTYDLSTFEGRHLKIWLRSIYGTGSGATRSNWSTKSVTIADVSDASFAASFALVVDRVLATM